jgi:hypothetical protein
LFNYVDGISKDVAGIKGRKEKIQLEIDIFAELKISGIQVMSE